MAGRLSGKVCIITGSGGSMGRAAAIRFAAEGARVIGCDVNVESALETIRLVTADGGGEMASLQPCDLTDAKQCRELVEFALSTYGKIDVLFNNAAMAYFGWIDQMAEEDWYKTINQELHLVFLLTKAAWPELAKRGGSIINTASVSAHLGFKVLPGLAHSAAKGAIVSMTRHLAMEGRAVGIRANSISPGLIETNQTRPLLDDANYAESMLGKIMLGRAGRPEEIANAALFFASDESSYATGADLLVDGGMTAW
jgi:NAD(P)-dependent dehydrogenase (short-subunit alcohol dehydrogenase family)